MEQIREFTNEEISKFVAESLVVAEQAAIECLAKVGDGFPCGFAWTNVRIKGSTKLGKLLLNNGFEKAFYGGLEYWMPARKGSKLGHVQNMEVHEAGAKAFADAMMKRTGIVFSYGSRMD